MNEIVSALQKLIQKTESPFRLRHCTDDILVCRDMIGGNIEVALLWILSSFDYQVCK